MIVSLLTVSMLLGSYAQTAVYAAEPEDGDDIALYDDSNGNDLHDEEIELNDDSFGTESDNEIVISGHYDDYDADINWSIDTSGVMSIDGKGMFYGGWYLIEKVVDNDDDVYKYLDSVKSLIINVDDFDPSVEDVQAISQSLCLRMNNLEFVDMSGFDTSKMTCMYGMLSDLPLLKEVKFGGKFDTKNVTDMGHMFQGLGSIKNIDLTGFDTRKVTSIECLFDCCDSLESIDMSMIDLSSISEPEDGSTYPFWDGIFNGCISLTEINTPINIPEGIKIKLPYVFNDSTGKEYQYLPCGDDSKESITLRHGEIKWDMDKDAWGFPNYKSSVKLVTPEDEASFPKMVEEYCSYEGGKTWANSTIDCFNEGHDGYCYGFASSSIANKRGDRFIASNLHSVVKNIDSESILSCFFAQQYLEKNKKADGIIPCSRDDRLSYNGMRRKRRRE